MLINGRLIMFPSTISPQSLFSSNESHCTECNARELNCCLLFESLAAKMLQLENHKIVSKGTIWTVMLKTVLLDM